METELSDVFLVEHLEDVARLLDIEIRYEVLSDDEISIQSGACRFLGRKLMIIDARRLPGERARILARELGRYDLEDFYILPRVRAFILFHSSSREKNLPHK
jgi:hypothetical protein